MSGTASFARYTAHSTDWAGFWGHKMNKTGHLPSGCSWLAGATDRIVTTVIQLISVIREGTWGRVSQKVTYEQILKPKWEPDGIEGREF